MRSVNKLKNKTVNYQRQNKTVFCICIQNWFGKLPSMHRVAGFLLNAREQELEESHEADALVVGICGNVAACDDNLLETVVDFEERP